MSGNCGKIMEGKLRHWKFKIMLKIVGYTDTVGQERGDDDLSVWISLLIVWQLCYLRLLNLKFPHLRNELNLKWT